MILILSFLLTRRIPLSFAEKCSRTTLRLLSTIIWWPDLYQWFNWTSCSQILLDLENNLLSNLIWVEYYDRYNFPKEQSSFCDNLSPYKYPLTAPQRSNGTIDSFKFLLLLSFTTYRRMDHGHNFDQQIHQSPFFLAPPCPKYTTTMCIPHICSRLASKGYWVLIWESRKSRNVDLNCNYFFLWIKLRTEAES